VHLNGCGNRFFAYVGIWSVLERFYHESAISGGETWAQRIAKLETISGSSGGSVVALAMHVGLTCQELREAVQPAVDDMRVVTHDPDIKRLTDNFGLFSTDGLRRIVQDVLARAGLSAETTFHRLRRLMGRRFAVKVTNLNEARTEVMDDATAPEVRVVDAVVASMSVPVLFAPAIIHGDMYVDGDMVASTAGPGTPEESCVWFLQERGSKKIETWADFAQAMTRSMSEFENDRATLLPRLALYFEVRVPKDSLAGIDLISAQDVTAIETQGRAEAFRKLLPERVALLGIVVCRVVNLRLKHSEVALLGCGAATDP
jgi:hypothetical protein